MKTVTAVYTFSTPEPKLCNTPHRPKRGPDFGHRTTDASLMFFERVSFRQGVIHKLRNTIGGGGEGVSPCVTLWYRMVFWCYGGGGGDQILAKMRYVNMNSPQVRILVHNLRTKIMRMFALADAYKDLDADLSAEIVHMGMQFLHCSDDLFLFATKKDLKTPTKMILTSKWNAKHPFASRNTQQHLPRAWHWMDLNFYLFYACWDWKLRLNQHHKHQCKRNSNHS